MKRLFALLLGLFLSTTQLTVAGSGDELVTQPLGHDAYAIVGPYGNRTAQNLGNNATFGFIVTDDGVVLIDSGGTYLGAKAIERKIQEVTDQPVKLVINTGGQDHRWLGNGYFKAQGARIIANRHAVEDQRARLNDQLFMLGNLVGEAGLRGTEGVFADQQFDSRQQIEFGGVRLELIHAGQAHTPGDSVVWLPDARIVFTGDIVYVGRMLGVMPHSDSASWIDAFNAMAALEPETLVPGHGKPTDLAHATADTLDYLAFLRSKVAELMDDGGDITQVGNIDQSRFAYLVDFETLKGRNAQQVFQQMEWE